MTDAPIHSPAGFAFGEPSEGQTLRRQEGEPTVVRHDRVIWKRARQYDPMDPRPTPKSAWALFNECAALAHLDGLEIQPRVSPRLIAADLDVGVLAIEDLGDGPGLVELLHGGDADAAAAACVAHARALARLHRRTIGRDAAFHAERDALGPGGRHALYQDYAAQIDQFRSVCGAAGVDWRPCDDELREVLSSMEDPPPAFHGMVHGDVGPGNEKVIDADVVLIDFEVAGFGHVLREAVAARLVFTEGDNSAVLPLEVVGAMESAYRAEFGLGVEDWSRDYALCAAYHVIAEVGWDAASAAVDWRTTYRCRAFVEIAEQTGRLTKLGHTMRELGRSMPACADRPSYPVFG